MTERTRIFAGLCPGISYVTLAFLDLSFFVGTVMVSLIAILMKP